MWIENNDLELMNSIFETEELIPRNRKGGLNIFLSFLQIQRRLQMYVKI